jgi:hypothetical protein
VRRTARQGFNTHGPRACEEVQNSGTFNYIKASKGIEHCLTDHVRGRARGVRCGRFYPPSSKVTCYHSHRRQTTAVITPSESIVCVDCGGPCHLLTSPREDGTWMVDDVVSYRCRDCRDIWYIELTEDDNEQQPD